MTAYEIDDDGFVCVVSPDGYAGFVDEDWDLNDLLSRFVEQLNAGSLFLAYLGDEAAGAALTLTTQEPETAVRSTSGVVHVGDGGLWLTDYTQLTMAAQFADEAPVTASAQRLASGPGTYLVVVSEIGEEEYTLTVRPHVGDAPTHASVPWFTS